MHRWEGGKTTQKVVVYPIPRNSWDTHKVDTPYGNDHENLLPSGNEAYPVLDNQNKNLSFQHLTLIDGLPERRSTEREMNSLKDQLDSQFKVNSDLKKLLVASIGDDLHCKMDVLVRTKAILTNEVNSFANKLIEDYENIDKLTIETNLWRTKFQASCVLLNLLTSEKNQLHEAFMRSQNSLQTLLDERRCLNSVLLRTDQYLSAIQKTLFPLQNLYNNEVTPRNTTELAESNSASVEDIYKLLHGSHVLATDLPSPSRRLTFAEALAARSLSSSHEDMSINNSEIINIVQSSKTFMGTTFNCCKKCRGRIINV